ncbi:hypothetical protein [Bradyrhizobium sp. RT6a]|uniref:hypothetical protein n=1 Tax=unclassified Bradyrhizobium TaxID=2631580 RepID=UPI00339958EC
MTTTGASRSSTTIAHPLQCRGPLAAGHLEAVADLGGGVVGHLLLEGHPVVAAGPAERPMEKDLSRREGTPEIRPHMEGSIVQMKTTSGATIPSASEPPLDFRAQPAPSIKNSSTRCYRMLSSLAQWSVPRAWAHEYSLITRRRIVIGDGSMPNVSRFFL